MSGLSQPQSNLGFVSFDIPGIELDEGVETALGGLAALLATGIGLYGIYFVAKPILGLIGDTRKAFRSFKKLKGDEMVDANALNAAIENYLDKVDDYIKAYSMDDKRGTEVLDPIQRGR